MPGHHAGVGCSGSGPLLLRAAGVAAVDVCYCESLPLRLVLLEA